MPGYFRQIFFPFISVCNNPHSCSDSSPQFGRSGVSPANRAASCLSTPYLTYEPSVPCKAKRGSASRIR